MIFDMVALKQTFVKEYIPILQEKLGIKNPMAVPRVVKIVLNTSSKEFLQDKKNIDKAREDIEIITGQAPKVTKARIAVSTFKLREGDKIGLSVTLRGRRMYDFIEKIVKIVLPRVKDFSGVDSKAFDGRGNLTIGFSEHTVFPEIEPGKVDKLRGLQITIVTNAENNQTAKILLETIGIPFKKGASS